MVDGQRIHRVIGMESAGVTREQPERAIETHRTDARAGRLNLPSGRKIHRSLEEAATDYLKRIERGAGKDVANKKRNLTQKLISALGKVRFDRLSSQDIEDYARGRLTEAEQATVNRELATLSYLLNRAIDWG